MCTMTSALPPFTLVLLGCLLTLYMSRYVATPPAFTVAPPGFKTVWQTYSTYDAIPYSIRIARRRMMDANPTWRFVVMSDRDALTFLANLYPDAARVFLDIRPMYGAVKADVWRYAILHAFGGLYLDMDSYITTPLDEWLVPEAHTFSYSQYNFTDRMPLWQSMRAPLRPPLGSQYKTKNIVQWAMAAPKGSPVMKTALELALHRLCHEPNASLFSSEKRIYYASGPDVLLHALWRFPELAQGAFTNGPNFDGHLQFKMQGLPGDYRHHNNTILQHQCIE